MYLIDYMYPPYDVVTNYTMQSSIRCMKQHIKLSSVNERSALLWKYSFGFQVEALVARA